MGGRRAPFVVGAVAACLGAGSAAAEGLGVPGLVAGLVVGVALGLSLRRPRVGWLVATGALLALAPLGIALGVTLIVAGVAFCAARGEPARPGLLAFAALAVALQLGVLSDGSAFVPALLLPFAGWATGRALRERELVVAELAERARELAEEREAYAALSVRYERARIASELHDIVAHAISVMVVQAGAGQRLAAHDPAATAETFDVIAEAARQAERDMGRLVALLGDEEPIGPAPDLALVEELVARASSSGLRVTLRLEGEREGLPATAVETAYRLIQEGLTNALRYAAGAPVAVTVRGDSECLLVSVVNPPAGHEPELTGSGTGNGLRGLRERVGALGGTLEAGPTAAGGWRLAAQLPSARVAPAHPHG